MAARIRAVAGKGILDVQDTTNASFVQRITSIKMEFRQNQPIYLQIAEYVCEQILLEKWPLGDKILSIRDLAAFMEVTPTTVQRAYDFLQQRNIITNKRGIGYFAEDGAMERIRTFRREQFLENELPVFLRNLYLLNIDMAALKDYYDQFLQNNFQDKLK
jgi:DNA-binding transcriptional regulator YhcF (GntR family)